MVEYFIQENPQLLKNAKEVPKLPHNEQIAFRNLRSIKARRKTDSCTDFGYIRAIHNGELHVFTDEAARPAMYMGTADRDEFFRRLMENRQSSAIFNKELTEYFFREEPEMIAQMKNQGAAKIEDTEEACEFLRAKFAKYTPDSKIRVDYGREQLGIYQENKTSYYVLENGLLRNTETNVKYDNIENLFTDELVGMNKTLKTELSNVKKQKM